MEILVAGCTVRVIVPSLYHKKVFLLPEGSKNHGRCSHGRLNFVLWDLVSASSQYGTCFKSPFWRLEYLRGLRIFGKLVNPCINTKQCLSGTQCEGKTVTCSTPVLLHCS